MNDFLKINYTLNRIITEDKAYFPSVIICNVNPFVTNYAIDYLIDLVENTTSYPPFADTNYSKIDYLNTVFVNDRSMDRQLINYRQNIMLDEGAKQKLGFTLDQLIYRCVFNNRPCNASNFKWVHHWDYGSCFRFNFNNTIEIFDTGKNTGLTLELFSGIDSYAPGYFANFGFKIMIVNQSDHDEFSFLFPDVSIATRFQTDIKLNRLYTNQEKKPYSSCEVNSDDTAYYSKKSYLFKVISRIFLSI